MKILVVGAGTIGLTYSWMLSLCHNVTVYVREERLAYYQRNFVLDIQDMRDNVTKHLEYSPKITTTISGEYDVILIMVNRIQLGEVLPILQNSATPIVFMLNHWDIEDEVGRYLSPEQYYLGFPSQVGGGREGNKLDVIVFEEGTILGEPKGKSVSHIADLGSLFTQAGLTVEVKLDISDWLKVHYLQQSLSVGAIAKSGSYDDFARSYAAIIEMVHAFREGVAVCKAQGVDTKRIFPANMFRYPAFLVAWAMKGMFNKPETRKMVNGHMKQGMPEWIAGFNEVLADGERLGVDMTVWKSYKPYVDSLK